MYLLFLNILIFTVFKDAITCYEFGRAAAANTTMADAFRNDVPSLIRW
jgi:hypothetical protein